MTRGQETTIRTNAANELQFRVKRGIGYLYRKVVRPLLLTAGPVRYAGVPISRDRKWGDLDLSAYMRPYNVTDIPDYEAGITRSLTQHVRPVERVVIVGGGEGVSVVVAAKMAGPTGSVVCFEGSAPYAKRVHQTAEMNRVADRVYVVHAVVGEDISVYGGAEVHASASVEPINLPSCDVLELDCEGSEIGILTDMTIAPPTIIVETHGHLNAPTSKVRALLERRGYEVVDLGWAKPNRLDDCQKSDVRVLVGTLPRVENGGRPQRPLMGAGEIGAK